MELNEFHYVSFRTVQCSFNFVHPSRDYTQLRGGILIHVSPKIVLDAVPVVKSRAAESMVIAKVW